MIEFNYENESIESDLNVYDLVQWIAELHTELTDAGILPDGVSTETHLQLMAFAKEAEVRFAVGR